ncbi:MAG: hypothetical protein P1U56_01650 [Saprospiraceae bacterium]|nr:hypothetical protein [Saprospiraceae bacterium]
MKFILSLLLVLFFFNGFGQADFLAKNGSNYFYKGKGYKYKELTPIYKQHEPAYKMYMEGVGLRKKASRNGLNGLYLIGGGALAVYALSSLPILSLDDSPNPYTSIGVIAVLGGYVLEIIALIQRFKGDSKLRKAVDIFNLGVIEKHGYKQETSLHLNQTSNGIGLVFSF